MVPKESRDLILAGAIVSIMVNPFVFTLLERLSADKETAANDTAAEPDTDLMRRWSISRNSAPISSCSARPKSPTACSNAAGPTRLRIRPDRLSAR
jgi:hypothetical protein